MDLRREKVTLETDRYRVEGRITLPAEGYSSRVSDHVNRRDIAFVTLQDATLTPLDGGEAWSAPVVMVGSRHIRLIVQAEQG